MTTILLNTVHFFLVIIVDISIHFCTFNVFVLLSIETLNNNNNNNNRLLRFLLLLLYMLCAISCHTIIYIQLSVWGAFPQNQLWSKAPSFLWN